MNPPTYDYYTRLAQTINSGQSRSILLYGNVGDLFLINDGQGAARYVPLVQFLTRKWSGLNSVIQIVVELNGPLSFIKPRDSKVDPRDYPREAWNLWKRRIDPSVMPAAANKEFDDNVNTSSGQSAFALEFLRQVCMAVRSYRHVNPGNHYRLIICIESAEMVVPAGSGDISQLQPLDRRKVAILEDWFSDPEFYEGSDTILLISQGRSQIHPRITKMPQLAEIEIKSPDSDQRGHFIEWQWHEHVSKNALYEPLQPPADGPPWNFESIAKQTAGLSLLALRQLLIESAYLYPDQDVPPKLVIAQVEDFVKSQLGEEVVEFKRPTHTLDDVVGFRSLKKFMREKLIPRIQKGGRGALSAMAVAGPIGVGKTFCFEAMAAELDVPVIVLKSIRSKWFGETDTIFENLRRLLESIGKCLIFVDEADTQFGGVGGDTHETERRLTGKVQQMMSDPKLKGQVLWLLMTARIHQLSPDMRRQGRAGDLIIPVLDPDANSPSVEDEQGRPTNDHMEFVRWILRAVLKDRDPDPVEESRIRDCLIGRSAASFAMIRSLAISEEVKTLRELEALIADVLEPDIGKVRRYQELQALLNCTRASLLPTSPHGDPVEMRRDRWREQLQSLENEGYR